jgi:hypothetical protein
MIIAIIQAKMPEGLTREQHAERSKKSAERFLGLSGLMRKNFLADFDKRVGGGVYCWETREAAEATHSPGSAWWENFTKSFGVEPEVSFFESPVLVDNVLGRILTPEEAVPAEGATT